MSFVNGLTEEEERRLPVYVPPHWERCKLCGKELLEIADHRGGKIIKWQLCDCAQEKIKELGKRISGLEERNQRTKENLAKIEEILRSMELFK